VEINGGVYLLKSSIRQMPLFTSDGLGLVLKNLVLFTSLMLIVINPIAPDRNLSSHDFCDGQDA